MDYFIIAAARGAVGRVGWMRLDKMPLRVFALVFIAKMITVINWNPWQSPKGVRREQ